jgi:uncharacterized membrane protein
MDLTDRLSSLTPLDGLALGLLLGSWMFIGWWIEHPTARTPSVTIIMAEYRREWMRQMITREPRIFDASIMANLRQGTAFFASGCMLAIGGVLAVIGNTEALEGVATEFTIEGAPSLVWQVKLLVVVMFLTHAFLKFVWANRLFGYCSVVMAAVPNDITDKAAMPRALQAAEINIRAAWNFNRGLRSIYYGLGTLAWLLGPFALLCSTGLVAFLIWQREFASRPREILMVDIPTEET